MTILTTVGKVALKIGIAVPTAVYTSVDRDMLEMQALISEMATDIVECFPWQVLTTLETITGDGSTEGHALPSDYEEMLVGSNLWSSRWTWAFQHITSPDEWLEYQVVPYTFVNGNWMIFGGTIHILPIMASTENVKYFYKSNLYVSPAAGSNKNGFTADNDTFVLSEKLLYLGLVWKWKQKKGEAYAEDLETYEEAKGHFMGTDRGSKPKIGNRHRRVSGSQWAFPSTVGG